MNLGPELQILHCLVVWAQVWKNNFGFDLRSIWFGHEFERIWCINALEVDLNLWLFAWSWFMSVLFVWFQSPFEIRFFLGTLNKWSLFLILVIKILKFQSSHVKYVVKSNGLMMWYMVCNIKRYVHKRWIFFI